LLPVLQLDGLSDLPEAGREVGQHRLDRLAQRAVGGHAQNLLGGAVEDDDPVVAVGGDHAAGNGGQHIVEELLEFGDLGQGAPGVGEKPGVLNGDGGLVGESDQQRHLTLAEQVGHLPVVGVEHASHQALVDQWDADDGAGAVRHDAALDAVARVEQRIASDHRLAGLGGLAHDCFADGEAAGVERLAVQVAPDAELKLARL